MSATTGSDGQAGRFLEVTGGNPRIGSRILYLPPGDLYPPYAADPVRIGFGVEPVRVHSIGIPDASYRRVNLRAGAEIGLVRWEQANRPYLGWQLSIAGGFNDQNDVEHSLDNIGWDGRYGVLVSTAPARELAFKLKLMHDSSHLGDEYIQKTGRKRIGYTRQEVAAGVSWFPTKRLRFYTEGGRSFSLGNRELMRPWRWQGGIEYEGARTLWRRRMAWYAAMDLQSYQERSWEIDTSVQTGFVVQSGGRSWRFGAAWYGGRPPIGEFFLYTERYVSIGLWIDI